MCEKIDQYCEQLQFLKEYPLTISKVGSEEHPAWAYAGMVNGIQTQDAKIVLKLKPNNVGDNYEVKIHLDSE